jgi:hypothetical protein
MTLISRRQPAISCEISELPAANVAEVELSSE